MTRTDVHSPKNLVTEDYEFVGCGDFGCMDEPGYSPVGPKGPGHYLLSEGWHFGENESAGDCFHCGARLRYYAVLKHLPTHTLIRVGETCLENRFDRATADFQRLRKQAALDRQKQRVKTAREAWRKVHPAEFDYLADYNEAHQSGGGKYNDFYSSLWGTLGRHGELSERQLAALQRSIERQAQWAAQKAAEDADEPEAAPVIEGRIAVSGKVLSVQWRETAFGSVQKMLVRDGRGFKLWGTVPAAINPERGDQVELTATVEASNDDPCFGFYKRPTQAKMIETEEVAAA